MKVYVLTSGSYSDYHVECVTLNKENAEKLRDLHQDNWDPWDIEEYDTDTVDVLVKPDKYTFNVTILMDTDMNVTRIRAEVCFGEIEFGVVFVDRSWPNGKSRWKVQINVMAKNNEQAKKIALDKLAEWKAKQSGIT